MAASGKKNMFNEATRVQMPAMVHLTRLGYTYFGKITEDMAGTVYDPDTNILIDVFKEQFARLNPTHVGEAEQTLKTIRQELDNDDIGRSFYERLSSVSPVRLVDFENPQNNTYHFTAEFTCKRDQDEFRPDITLFVNGLPLVFVEVKKPNNHGGMVAESKRMNQKRFPNKKFRRFLNITQLMIFSNNMEYEAHRGYKPEGSFLANLLDADKNAIKIALTGTPLLKEERESWRVFGNYIHTYYYDKSILDGYTLKIIREDIETQYKERLSEIYEKLETLVEKKDVKKSQIVEHDNYVKELLRYIISDLKRFRQIQGDNTLGGMVICETSEQARKLFAYFDEIQAELNKDASMKSHLRAGLILHDSDDKDTRDKIIDDFKNNMTVDILIVFNMLLTGFDAPRLKRLYFGRKLKDHNLLQAITRVNRPYKENHYGYVIDFANIKRNFEETNEAYLKELNRFNDPNEVGAGNETDTFKQVIEDPAELIKQMQEVQQVLFNYTTDNAEEFSSEISTIEDKQELLKLKKILIAARDCCNLVRTFGDDELKETFAKMELTKLPSLISEVQHHIDNINQKELFASDDTTKLLVNEAMEDITFNFSKISEEELKIVGGKDAVTEKYKKTVRAFTQNIDPDDPEFITLQEAFLLRFKQHGFEPKSVSEIEEQGKELEDILKKLDELQKKNTVLLRKYNGDAKFARVHKRIREENLARKAANKQPIVSEYDMSIMNVLLSIKSDIDQKVYDRNDILKKDAYFERTVMTQIKAGIDKLGIASAREDRVFIQSRITKQYLDQYNQTYSVA